MITAYAQRQLHTHKSQQNGKQYPTLISSTATKEEDKLPLAQYIVFACLAARWRSVVPLVAFIGRQLFLVEVAVTVSV